MESVRQGLRQRPDDADARTVRDAVRAGHVCQEVVLKTLVAVIQRRKDGALPLGCKPTGRVGGMCGVVICQHTCHVRGVFSGVCNGSSSVNQG